MGCSSSSAAGKLLERASSATAERQFHEEYVLGEKVGEGAFGLILLARPRSESSSPLEKDSRAVKVLPLQGKDFVTEAREEVRVWQLATGHSSVVGLHDAFFESSVCYMVMELCTCSVMDHLQSLIQAGETDLGIVIRGMLLGLAHCSISSVAHRDVKPDNFLLGPPEVGSNCRTVKLADFGLAAVMPADGLLFDVVGTAPYMSPEMVGQIGYDVGTDVWSLGVVAYVMLFGEFPFGRASKTSDEMKQAITRGMAPRFQPADANLREPSPDAMDFVRTVLCPRASTRPRAAEALELAFMEQSATAQPALGIEAPNANSSAKSVTEAIAAQNAFLLQPVLREAQKVTAEFRRKADPTVQRDLNDLLRKLQSQYQPEASVRSPTSKRSFEAEDVPSPTNFPAFLDLSLDGAPSNQGVASAPIQGYRPLRRKAKCNTWAGERSISLFEDSPSNAPTTATFPSTGSRESGGRSLGLSEFSLVAGPRPFPSGCRGVAWGRRPQMVQAPQPRAFSGVAEGICLGDLSPTIRKPVCLDDNRHSS